MKEGESIKIFETKKVLAFRENNSRIFPTVSWRISTKKLLDLHNLCEVDYEYLYQTSHTESLSKV